MKFQCVVCGKEDMPLHGDGTKAPDKCLECYLKWEDKEREGSSNG